MTFAVEMARYGIAKPSCHKSKPLPNEQTKSRGKYFYHMQSLVMTKALDSSSNPTRRRNITQRKWNFQSQMAGTYAQDRGPKWMASCQVNAAQCFYHYLKQAPIVPNPGEYILNVDRAAWVK
jgi:hypothetical protein